MKNIAKWLIHDPQRTKEAAKKAGLVFAAFLLVWVGWSLGRGGQQQTVAATPGQTETGIGAWMAPGGQPGSPSPTTIPDDPPVPETGSIDTVATAFLNAYFAAPSFEASKRGHASWSAKVSPFTTGQMTGLVSMGNRPPKVRADKDGKPLKVDKVSSLGQIGDTAEIQATLTDGSTARVMVGAVGADRWAVSSIVDLS